MPEQSKLRFVVNHGSKIENQTINISAPKEDAPIPRENCITAKFSDQEKEELRKFANEMNTGMSTLLWEAWHFYRKFYAVRHVMLRFHQHFVEIANSLSKIF